MKKHRYICCVCGHGFHAKANEVQLGADLRLLTFCKKKCAIRWFGPKWKPGLYKKREKAH